MRNIVFTFLLLMEVGCVKSQVIGLFKDQRDNTEYKFVIIGEQVWMAHNLRTGRFLNGDKIKQAKSSDEWMDLNNNSEPAWCYLNFDSTNEKKYGRLYNWYAVSDPRGLAPAGWHIPADEEWSTLYWKLEQGKYNAGVSMKSVTGWKNGTGNNNKSGFSALPSGAILCNGVFFDGSASWWSSTPFADNESYSWDLYDHLSNAQTLNDHCSGLSVRCVRN